MDWMGVATEAGTKLAENLGTTALAIGALGTSAYGIVDGLKLCSWIDLAGFERLFSGKGRKDGRLWLVKHKTSLNPLLPALKAAYGADAMELLKSQYRSGRSKGDLPRTLRQGVRIGFGMFEHEKEVVTAAVGLGLAKDVAESAADALKLGFEQRPPKEGEAIKETTSIDDNQKAALARLETAIDARIDSALSLAEVEYVGQTKGLAMLVSIGIALFVGCLLGQKWPVSLVVGIVAVPLAPVAKDLATALQSAVKAMGGR
jgi:hypothetical protein